jgi:nicotinamide mononucleotide transporter
MSPLELTAAVFGAVSVYLSAREKILSWPTALVNVALYAVVFREQRLYADMGLQVIYFVLSLYGWYEWRFGGANRTPLRVSRITSRVALRLGIITVVAWLGLGAWLDTYTDAAIPWLDAGLSMGSLAAQFLMTRKVLESWALWIALDLIYIPTFLVRGMHPTAALYTIFLALAFLGWRDWRRSLQPTAFVPAT